MIARQGLFCVVLLGWIAGVAFGQRTEPRGGQRLPMLWQVTGKGGSSVYLFGTIHMGITAGQALTARVWEKFAASRRVALEADIWRVDPLAYFALTKLSADRSLRKALPPATWKKLVELFDGGLSPAELDRFIPGFLEALVLRKLIKEVAIAVPMELTLISRAKKGGKKLLHFESWRHQMKVLRGLPLESMAQRLADILAHPAKYVRRFHRLRRAYLAGDVELLGKIMFGPEEVKKYPKMVEKLVYERNRQWLVKVEGLLATGGGFVAVGIAHLVGDKNLLDLLSKRGYEVRRVR